jgi:rSAM/selenodomain-associated transferase 1
VRRGWLAVFAKAPLSGSVKTRLSPPLSPGDAAELYRCLLADVLEESAAAASALDVEAVIAVDPPGAAADLVATAPAGFRTLAQCGADLGARMAHVARQAAAAGAPFALLRGSDSPALGRAELGAAVLALARDDLVLRPDRDGGYQLVGLGARALERGLGRRGLFDHPMSTPSVCRDTLAQAAGLGLSAGLLAGGFDIDRFEDLRWLAAERHGNASLACPRTLAFLDQRRLWPPPAASRTA